MEELIIVREQEGSKIELLLTDKELEQAYRIMENRYLNEYFNKKFAEAQDNIISPAVLISAPEINLWLIQCFHNFSDPNMSHNDLIELCINHLKHEITSPFFYKELQNLSNPICLGYWKNDCHCEENCPKFSQCSNIAEAEERQKDYERVYYTFISHKQKKCSCYAESEFDCSIGKLISGNIKFSEFLFYELGR